MFEQVEILLWHEITGLSKYQGHDIVIIKLNCQHYSYHINIDLILYCYQKRRQD